MIKELRDLPVKMSVLEIPNSNGSHYLVFFKVGKMRELARLLKHGVSGQICFSPAPERKPLNELAQGERSAKDGLHGWRFVLHSDPQMENGADLMAIATRPTNRGNVMRSTFSSS